jgi:hypothetical protein
VKISFDIFDIFLYFRLCPSSRGVKLSRTQNAWLRHISNQELEKEIEALLPFREWYECEDPDGDVLNRLSSDLGAKIRHPGSKVNARLDSAVRRMNGKCLILRERTTSRGRTIITGILLMKHIY